VLARYPPKKKNPASSNCKKKTTERGEEMIKQVLMNKISPLVTLSLPANLIDAVLPAQSLFTLLVGKQNTRKQIMACSCAKKRFQRMLKLLSSTIKQKLHG